VQDDSWRVTSGPRGAEAPAVAVCSVTYNRRELMIRVLEQVRELDYPRECVDVFVVDNASDDDTCERIAEGFPEVRLIRSRENLGVSAGFNAAIRAALEPGREYEYVWLLDSDAEIEKRTLQPLVAAMEDDPSIGLIGSTVYDPQQRERPITLGLRVDWRRAAVELLPPTPVDSERLADVELIPACSSLTRTRLFRRLGLWDERFWLYWGDTDWCARVLRDGRRVCCHRESRVWHRDWSRVKRDFGAPFVLYDDLRGGLLFNLRHAPDRTLRGVRRLMLKGTLRAALESLTLRPGFGVAQEQAMRDFLAGRFERRGPASWPQDPPPCDLDAACRNLSGRLPRRPRVLLNRIADPALASEIRAAFETHFAEVRWKRLRPLERGERPGLSIDVGRYLTGDLPQMLWRLLCLPRRHDVIVSDVAVPCLYNLVAAEHTLLVNADGRALLRENRLAAGIANAVTTLLRGLKRAYLDLPRAARGCPPLIAAAAEPGGSGRGAE